MAHLYFARALRVEELIAAAHDIGLEVTEGQVLSDRGNLDPGPHPVGNTWFTLWHCIPPVNCAAPSVEETYSLLRSMESGFSSYPNKLPRLGAWTPVADAVKSISRHDDERINFLVRTWGEVDIRLRSFARSKLVPAHGDAHLGNLIASPYGWLWMDLEDVSLMPPLWDLATMVGRSFLFQRQRVSQTDSSIDFWVNTHLRRRWSSLTWPLAARLILSVSLNLELAMHGHGDLDRCWRGLDNTASLLPRILQE